MESKLVKIVTALLIVGFAWGQTVILNDGESTTIGWTTVRCECDGEATPAPTSTPLPDPTDTPMPTSTPQPTSTPEPFLTATPKAGGKGAAVPTNDYCPEDYGQDAVRLGASWLYDWSREPYLVDGVESVPMLYGAFEGCPDLGGNSEWILAANEPNVSGQSDLTPSEAAQQQYQIEQCYPDRRIVSASCVHDLDYLGRIRDAYISRYGQPPQWDALAVHCYYSYYQYCERDVQEALDLADEWGVGEVWVTEFIADGTFAMSYLLDYFESEPNVTRWAWFATRYKGNESWAPWLYTSLVECDGTALTAYGETYRD